MTWDVLGYQILGYAPKTADALIKGDKTIIQKLCDYLSVSDCTPDKIIEVIKTSEGISKLINFEFDTFGITKNLTLNQIGFNDPCSNLCLDESYFKLQVILATVATIAFFGIVGYVIAYGMANLTKEGSFIVGNLTGIAGAIAKDVYGYFFGSSIGSKQKSDTINKQHQIIKQL